MDEEIIIDCPNSGESTPNHPVEVCLEETEVAIDRVTRMERLLDEITEAVHLSPYKVTSDQVWWQKIQELTAYYEGGMWMQDYCRDERGEFPVDLKRGVLSQDAVYDLLSEITKFRSEKRGNMPEILWTRAERYAETVRSQMFFTDSVDELVRMLQDIADDVPLGWSDERSNIVKCALWARKGWFAPKMETFEDAFDYTVYTTQVWYYIKQTGGELDSAPADRHYGVEMHVLVDESNIEKVPQAVLLTTVGELRTFLSVEEEPAMLISRDENFELGGSLTLSVCLWLYQDIERGKACLILKQ